MEEEQISLSKYKNLLKNLEDEKVSHANTKTHLIEVQDNLELALGEIEILKKQVQREKFQYETLFNSLKSKAIAESHKNVELEHTCQKFRIEVEENDYKLSKKCKELT